ncbi:sensor histidine kinase [Nocardioides lijunqiniae]|uniref:sensor histidine kinase n=1 Tax=Nocardioides lijunqiniae TaxID=2760832 RepID=UPI001878113F|nr:histidine kinase [Nocardioides lijunqiniae]
MQRQLGSGDSRPLVAGRWSRRLMVATCSGVGVLAALVTMGEALDRPDPPSDDLMALWLLAEAAAALVAVPLLIWVLGRRSVAAGVALALVAPLGAAAPAAVLALVMLVSLRSWRTGVLVVAAFVASTGTWLLVLEGDEAPGLLVVLAVVTVLLVLVGLVVGTRRALAEQATREQALVVEQARSQERTRIAGEMHDTLSHHLSLIALHAGALGRRGDLPPETVRSSSRLVADLSRTAHSELREVLGVLHQAPQSTVPPLGASGLPDLVDQHRAAGARVRADLDPAVVRHDGRLSEATSRLLARAVRELLANAARHAAGEPVDLAVASHSDGVVLTCRNRTVGPERVASATGLGLEGIAERVRLAGGRYEAGVADDHFVVRVSVPW